MQRIYLTNSIIKKEIERFILDFQNAGCNLLRFFFVQPFRGLADKEKIETVPLIEEKNKIISELKDWINKLTMMNVLF